MESGVVFNLQKYSIHDGPGIRTTVFLKGCPLECWWCHNPEGMSGDPEIVVAEGRCTACGQCRAACPQCDAGLVATRLSRPIGPSCQQCGACLEACPMQARQILGRRMTVGEVLAEISKDQIFYDDSHGGVTFSGGEPFAQAGFLLELLRACRHREIHTAVDTTGYRRPGCGCWPRPTGPTSSSTTSRFSTTPGIASYTGVSNAKILENLEVLGREHGNIWVRVPIVPGLNDADSDLEATVRFAASVPGVKQVNLLTYHHTGAYKFSRLGKPYLRRIRQAACSRVFRPGGRTAQGTRRAHHCRRLNDHDATNRPIATREPRTRSLR